MTKLSAQIRKLLTQLVRARNKSNDELEEIHDAVSKQARELPRQGIVDALDAAIGWSRKRREAAIHLLAEWTDTPEVLHRIEKWLNTSNAAGRWQLLETISYHKLTHLAPVLPQIIETDPDQECRRKAISAAVALGDRSCLPTLLRVAERREANLKWILAIAFQEFADESCRPHLDEWFLEAREAAQLPDPAPDDFRGQLEKDTRDDFRLQVSWGLAKLQDNDAIEELIAMLDDPDLVTETTTRFGKSIPAARALCDVFGWRAGGNRTCVARTKEHLAAIDRYPNASS